MRRVLMVALMAVGSLCAGASSAQTNDKGVTTAAGAGVGAAPNLVFSTGSLNSNGSPTSVLRVFRDGVASTCGTSKVFPGTTGAGLGPYAYTTVSYTNTGPARCATITLTAACTGGGIAPALFLVAYSGAPDPNNLATNYLADAGSSTGTGFAGTPMSLNLAANQTITLMVEQVNGAPTTPASSCTFALQDEIQVLLPTMSPVSIAAMAGFLALLGFVFLRRRAGQR